MHTFLFKTGCLFLFCALACTKSGSEDSSLAGLDATERSLVQKLPENTASAGCEVFRPVVMVHGFLASGDTWSKFAQYFTSNGYCNRQMYAFDWNSLNTGANNSVALNALIDTVLARTGAAQVDLIGHSAGGGVCYTYLNNPVYAVKVAHYAHIGSNPQNAPAGPGGAVPTLNLWSDGDLVVSGAEIPGATNVMLPGQDHYQIATSAMSFYQVYQFFNAQPPATVDIAAESVICLGGRALTFGENQPAVGAAIQLYYLDPATGERDGAPAAQLTADAQGRWLALDLQPNRPMEIVVQPTTGRTVHYFREPSIRTNVFVYLRVLPPPFSPAGLLLAGLPNSASQTVLNCFSGSQAVLNGRDSLLLNGTVLSTATFAAPTKTAISFFLYDGNNNSQTDFTPVGIFGNFTFLSGIDYWLDPASTSPSVLQLNGRTQRIRNIPSNQGIVVTVFD